MTRPLAFAMLVIAACGGDERLSAAEHELLGDGVDSVDTTGNIVDQIEVTLSGTTDPAQAPDAAASSSALAAKTRLTPSTCIDSTVQGNVVTHVLSGCTGPRGRMLSGTIRSTFTRDGACLHVDHTTTSFTIGGRSANGTLGVSICRSGTTETRMRSVTFSGTTRRDEPISLTGSWSVTLDTVTSCATQSGGLTGQIGARAIGRSDKDLMWCATQARQVPLAESESLAKLGSGTLVLSPTAMIADQNGDLTYDNLHVRFVGGAKIEVTDADGNTLLFDIKDFPANLQEL